MSIVPADSALYQQMEDVAELTMKGIKPGTIANQLGMTRAEVLNYQEQYRTVLSNDSEARDMARDHLNMMVKHYDSLIKKYYDLIDEIDFLDFSHQVAGQKNAALKAIAELEAKRLDALQKAGLLDSSELGDELAEMEEKQALLISILRDDLCPSCKLTVAQKLSRVTGRVEAAVEYDVIDVEAQ